MDGAEVLSYYEVVDSYGRVSHWTTTMSIFFACRKYVSTFKGIILFFTVTKIKSVAEGSIK